MSEQNKSEDDLPIQSRHFATLTGLFWLAMLLVAPLARRMGRTVDPIGPMEGAQLALGVYAISRIATEEKAGAFVRKPFTEPKPDVDLDQVADEKRSLYGSELKPLGEGFRATMGQLVTCSRCFGMWGAGSLIYLRTLAPAQARVITPALALAGANFFLQAAFARLVAKANIAETMSQNISNSDSSDADDLPSSV